MLQQIKFQAWPAQTAQTAQTADGEPGEVINLKGTENFIKNVKSFSSEGVDSGSHAEVSWDKLNPEDIIIQAQDMETILDLYQDIQQIRKLSKKDKEHRQTPGEDTGSTQL